MNFSQQATAARLGRHVKKPGEQAAARPPLKEERPVLTAKNGTSIGNENCYQLYLCRLFPRVRAGVTG
jgi:hypothetical protein